jgi:hypothetical protein
MPLPDEKRGQCRRRQPEVRDREQVLANGLNWNTQVMGESPDYPQIRNWSMASGTMFGDQDVRSLAKTAVIGKTVADQLFPNENPVGQTIRIRNLPFLIVGVLAAKGFNLVRAGSRRHGRRPLHEPHAPHHHAHIRERYSGGGRQRQSHRQRSI